MKAQQVINLTGLGTTPVRPAQVGAIPLQTNVVPLDTSSTSSILSGGLLETIISFMLIMMIMKMMMGSMSGMGGNNTRVSQQPRMASQTQKVK